MHGIFHGIPWKYKWQVGYSIVYYENTSEKWDFPWYTMKIRVTSTMKIQVRSGIFHCIPWKYEWQVGYSMVYHENTSEKWDIPWYTMEIQVTSGIFHGIPWKYKWQVGYSMLLYLPTEIRCLIGGERVTCHWLKLNDALGRKKLNDALGKQQLELWTRTWSRCAPWNRGKFVYRSAWCKKPLK